MFLKKLFYKVFGRKEEVTTSTKTAPRLHTEGVFADKVKTPPESTSKPGGQKRSRSKKV